MRKLSKAILKQRRGLGTKRAALDMQAPIGVGGSAPRAPRQAGGRMQGSADPRYGSYRWQQLSRKVRRERPRCEGECQGFFASAYADHVIEVRDDTSDASFFDEANVQALCARCHGRKTKREAARRAGLPEPKQGPVNCGVDPQTGYPRAPHGE